MTEAEELLFDVRAVYGEMFPGRDPQALTISDGALALGVTLRREMRLAEKKPYRVESLSTRILDRLKSYDPKDPE